MKITYILNRKNKSPILKYFFLTLIVLFNTINTLQAQAPVQYRLINADHLQHFKFIDENVVHLQGNVHFFYNEIEFLAEHAEIYESQEYVTLKGNVIIVQDSLRMTSNIAQYYKKSEYLRAEGRVVLTENKDTKILRQSTSNNAMHYRDRGEFILQGNVYAIDFSDSLHARAGYAIYNQQTGYGYLIQRPYIWKAGSDSLALFAEKIEYFEENKKMVASFQVITQNETIKATSDFLIYYIDEGKMIYIGNPKFYSEDGDGNADLITVYLDKKEINEILLDKNCYIKFNSEDSVEKENWVSSDYMTLIYKNKKPSVFNAYENVKSFFLQEPSNNKSLMNNNVEGDKLILHFNSDSQIETLNMENNIKGVYRFDKK